MNDCKYCFTCFCESLAEVLNCACSDFSIFVGKQDLSVLNMFGIVDSIEFILSEFIMS